MGTFVEILQGNLWASWVQNREVAYPQHMSMFADAPAALVLSSPLITSRTGQETFKGL